MNKMRALQTKGRPLAVGLKLLAAFSFVVVGAMSTADRLLPRAAAIAVDVEVATSGAELFENNCARCHGADGKGGKGPNLASEKRQAKWRESDEKLIKKITNGGMFMPSFGKKLKPEEIKAIADHVRTLKE